MAKVKVSITMDPKHLRALDEIGQQEERNRSQLLEFAVREWLNRHHPTLLAAESPVARKPHHARA